MVKKNNRTGNSAIVKVRELDALIEELNNTTIGSLNDDVNYLEDISSITLAGSDGNSINLVKLLKQMSDDVVALQSKKGLCPQALII